MASRADLRAVFDQALAACEGGALLRAALAEAPLPPGPLTLLGAGKAAVAMARAVAEAAGEGLRAGLVATKEGHGAGAPAGPLGGVAVLEAAHPVPDARSEAAGRAALARARGLGPEDTLCVVLSGGASALWAVPAPGLTLEDKRGATRALLAAGAPIGEINTVRKHLSAIKGGRLGEASGAGRLVTFLLSDVIGGGPDLVGSGPTLADPSTRDQALAIARRTPGMPARVVDWLAGKHAETPKRLPGEPGARVVGNHDTLRRAATEAASTRGLAPLLLPPWTGDVAALAQALLAEPAPAPGSLVIASGEPTVRVTGSGRGGRCQHLALLVAKGLRGTERVFLAAGSDGTDGPTPAAGAIVDGRSWDEARRRGLDPERALDRFDAHPLHAAMGDLVTTGPTGTNLCDLFLLA